MKVKALSQKNYPAECINPVTKKNEMCVFTDVQMICETMLDFEWPQDLFYRLQVKSGAINKYGYVNSYERAFETAAKNRKWYSWPIKKDWFFTTDLKVIIKAVQDRPAILFLGGHAVLAVEYLASRGMFYVIDPNTDINNSPTLLTRPIKKAGFFV